MTDSQEFGRHTKLNRFLIAFKFVLTRGYMWCQLPTLAIMGAGIITPYVKVYYPSIHMWQLCAFAMMAFLCVGTVDWWMGLFKAENSYTTEKNPMLLNLLKEKKDGNTSTQS